MYPCRTRPVRGPTTGTAATVSQVKGVRMRAELRGPTPLHWRTSHSVLDDSGKSVLMSSHRTMNRYDLQAQEGLSELRPSDGLWREAARFQSYLHLRAAHISLTAAVCPTTPALIVMRRAGPRR